MTAQRGAGEKPVDGELMRFHYSSGGLLDQEMIPDTDPAQPVGTASSSNNNFVIASGRPASVKRYHPISLDIF